MAELPEFITLDEAARRYRLDRSALTRLVETGKIRAVRVSGGVAVSTEDVKTSSIRKENFEYLENQEIRLSEAAEQYNIPAPILSNWVNTGKIRARRESRKCVFLNLADVAYAAALYRARGKKLPGKSVFPRGYTAR